MDRIGRYQILRKLGEGAMGEVYLARDDRLSREVAIKFLSSAFALDEERRQRFFREARAAAAISHPNVCVIHEIGETEDHRPFLALEYLKGQSLDVRLEQGPVTMAEALDIVTQAAEALEAAHEAGLVHRDIKPANIHLGPRGRVKVLDFGLAKRFGETLEEETLGGTPILRTQEGTLLGTPAYMSPEQALGQPLDARADLFSLGAVLYHLLTGRFPFGGSTIGEVLSNVVHRQPEAIARFNYEVSPDLERVVRKLLAKEPERRFQSARDLLVDLEDARRSLKEGGAATPRSDLEMILMDTIGPEGSGTVPLTQAAPPAMISSAVLASVPPEALASSDVVITYAPLDDQPVLAGRQGWISQFHTNLELRVAQLSGREVTVRKQPDASRAHEVEAKVLEVVPEVKTVVSILSPPFLRASGCRKVVERFWRSAEAKGSFLVNDRARILNVVKTPVELTDFPAEMSALYARLPPYEFFERDVASGRVREFDETFGEAARQRFYERVYDVAFDISQVLRHIGDLASPKAESGPSSTGGRKIYLALTTSDLEHQRDQLRRELIEAGCDVYPKQPLPYVATEIVTVVESCLECCDLAIHFVGERYGFVPEATEHSIVSLQNHVAAELSEKRELKRLIWMPRALVPQDERQRAFIRELEEGAGAQRGAELISDSLENLKVLLKRRWEKEAAAAVAAAAATAAATAAAASSRSVAAGSGAPPRLYLICDRQDEASIEALEDYFYEQGIEVSLPGFDAGESEVQQVHIQNLRDCDAALVYYGVAGMHWVDFNQRDLQKAAGYRGGEAIPATAVYLAPPFNRRKERFRSVSAQVIRQEGDALEKAGLSLFVESVRRPSREGER